MTRIVKLLISGLVLALAACSTGDPYASVGVNVGVPIGEHASINLGGFVPIDL